MTALAHEVVLTFESEGVTVGEWCPEHLDTCGYSGVGIVRAGESIIGRREIRGCVERFTERHEVTP